MNTRFVTSILALAILSLDAVLVPARAAPSEKPSRIEMHQQGEEPRKSPEGRRGQAHPVKNVPAAARQPAPAAVHRDDSRGREARGGPLRGGQVRGGSAPPGRSPGAPTQVRRDDRAAATWSSNRGDEGGRGQRYDASRSRHAYSQSRYVPARTAHHRYPSRRYYYPPRGYVAPVLPRNVVVVRHHNYHYWYGGGVWYRPHGTRYVVVAPPVGVFVSVLPSYYSTFWYGGVPYYYANSGYYVWRDTRRAYEVVPPPPGADAFAANPVTEDIFVYPAQGQSEEQVAFDRYECHRWAADETGFDPTQAWGGVSEDQAGALREAYLRAMTACLEGRGYAVR